MEEALLRLTVFSLFQAHFLSAHDSIAIFKTLRRLDTT